MPPHRNSARIARLARRLAAALAVVAAGSVLPAAAATHSVRLSESGEGSEWAVLTEEGHLYLEVSPLRGEGYAALAKRVTGDSRNWRAVHRANGGGSLTVSAGRRYRIPAALLPETKRAEVLRRLWPNDRFDGTSWSHQVTGDKWFGRSESLWQIASVFTGEGSNWKAIRTHNGMRGTRLQPGDVVKIPVALLRDEFAVVPAASPDDEEEYRITGTWVNGELEYGQDAQGPYAQYRLAAGEALYSAVVVRFTGRVDADEVNRAAEVVARRSGIRDVTDIPVGYPVKIPLELLTPEYLPPDHPRRLAYERDLAQGRDFARKLHLTTNLEGVVVILDAGHGGVDVGASNHVVWEDDYVYDILARVKQVLEEHTRARVVTTIRDESQQYRPYNGAFPSTDTDEVILTTPIYRHTDASQTAVAVHLRWYISNYHFRQAVRQGTPADRVVFTSFHADSLHPSVHGAMIYVPGREYRPSRYGKSGPPYSRYREVQDQPTVRFCRQDLVRSEGLSRAMAQNLVSVFGKRKIAVHPYNPVRNHVVRGGHAWVPAVLRYNMVPASLLVEVCNLNNPTDQTLLRDPAFRQRFAEAYVEGLMRYFEGR